MKIDVSGLAYRVGTALIQLLEDEISKKDIPAGCAVTLNFRDPDYCVERGGFHPVEIRVSPQGEIEYCTDFSFDSSGPFAELTYEIDFDFARQRFTHFGHEYPLTAGRELFGIWQQNFLSYYGMGVYEVEVQVD